MNVSEIAARLEEMIRRNRRTIKAVQEDAGVGNNYIWRLRKGTIEAPTMENLRAITEAAGGSWDEIRPLFEGAAPLPRDPDLDAILVEEYERKQGHGPERLRAAHILEDLIDRPELIEAWLLFGEHLLSRR